MKKLSLLITFMLLLVMVLALSVVADDYVLGTPNTLITAGDIEKAELISGETVNGHRWYQFFDSDPTYVIDGKYENAWVGTAGSVMRITLKNEWEISTIQALQWGNWKKFKIAVYAEDPSQEGVTPVASWERNVSIGGNEYWTPSENVYNMDWSQMLNDVPKGTAIKYIELTQVQNWSDCGPRTHELYIYGTERIPVDNSECTHDFEEKIIEAATCTKPGKKVEICKMCKTPAAEVVIPATGHRIGEYTIDIPATCTSGAVITYTCINDGCGETLTESMHVNDVTDFGDRNHVVTEGAGSSTSVNNTYVAFDNDWTTQLTASTSHYVQTEIPLDKAYYITRVTIWVGYGKPGNTAPDNTLIFSYKAPGSEQWIEVGTKHVPALSEQTHTSTDKHIYELETPVVATAVRVAVNPLRHASGMLWEVEVAGSIFADTIVKNHTWVPGEVVANTCSTMGYTTYTCSGCGEVKKDSFTYATGNHVYSIPQDDLIEATCTQDGSGSFKCETCSSITFVDVIPKLGHDVSIPATCLIPAKCSRCDYTEGEALNHVEGTPATCTTKAVCSLCNKEYGDFKHGELNNLKCPVCNKYVVTTLDELKSAMDKCSSTEKETIVLGADIKPGYGTNNFFEIVKPITLDFAGHTLEIGAYQNGIRLNHPECALISSGGTGTFNFVGNVAAVKLFNADTIQNININVKTLTQENKITGISIQLAKGATSAHVNSIKNVRIEGQGLSVGFETYQCGSNADLVINEMENVYINATYNGKAGKDFEIIGMTLQAPCGTFTNCTVTSAEEGVRFRASANWSMTGTFVNCQVTGSTHGLNMYSDGDISSTAVLAFKSDANTTFTCTSNPEKSFTAALNGAIDNIEVEISGVKMIAYIDGQFYGSFEEAYAVVPNGGTLQILADVELVDSLVIDKKITLDLNKYTVSAPNGVAGDGVFHVVAGGELTINGNGTVNGICANKAGYHMAIWAEDGGKVVINGGTFTNVGENLTDDQYDLIYAKNGGSIEINGGTFIAQTPKWTLNIYGTNTGTIVVNGGKFYAYNPSASESESPVANFVAEGKCVAPINNEGYVVVTNHNVVADNAVDATCTKTGLTAGSHCSVCNEVFVAQTVIPELGHTSGEAVNENVVGATCTTAGSYDSVVYCVTCTVELSRTPVSVPKLGHTSGTAVMENVVGTSCAAPGSYDSVVYCTVCTTELSRTPVSVDALPHTPSTAVTENEVEASCAAAGSYDSVVYCSVCTREISRTTVPVDALPHTPSAEAVKENEVAGTCTTKGSYDSVVYCTACPAEISRTTVKTSEVHSVNTDTRKCSLCSQYIVSDRSHLGTAISKASNNDTIRFIADVDFSSSDYWAIEKGLTIDLNGHTITQCYKYGSMIVMKHNDLVITSSARDENNNIIYGTIIQKSGNHALRVRQGKEVSNINILAEDKLSGGICFLNGNNIHLDTIKNVTISGDLFKYGIETYQVSNQGNEVIKEMDNVTIYAGYSDDSVSGTGMIVYAPYGTVKNCSISGIDVGVLLRVASYYQTTLTLENCKVKGGDVALQIWNDESATADSKLVLKSDVATTFTSESGKVYTASIGGNVDNVSIQISGVTLAALANGTLYGSFEEAYAATPAGGTIELLADLELADTLVIDKKITLDLNTYKVSAPNGKAGDGVFRVVAGGDLTIKGNGTVDGVCANAEGYHMAIFVNGGKVVIEGGRFTNVGENLTDDQYDLIYVKGGELVINGGTFIAQTPKWTLNLHDKTPGSIVVNGGKFYAYNPTESASESPVVDFTNGKCAVKNSENYYVVVGEHKYLNACDKVCEACYKVSRPEATHTIVHVDAKAATCTANGNKEYWTCSDCGFAWLDEACTLVANQKSVIVPATGHSYFTQCDPVCMNCYELTNPDAAHKITHVTAVAPTCTENGNIEYWYCEYCNTAWTSEALNTPPMGIKSTTLPATGHTKVEIPAVRPTPSNGNKAYTAGIKCADCNDIIQEVEEITVVQNQNTGFQIYNASLGLSDDITLIYLTYIPEEYRENAYMVFTYRGTEYVVDTKEEKDGIYRFRFSAVTPQYVGENIESVLYSKVNGEYVKTGTINYSVLAFCASWLNYDKTPVKTRTLMSDFLVYAAAAQVATNVNVDKLVTDGFGDKLTPSTFSKLDDSQFVMRLEGTADSRFAWKNVSLTLGSSVAMKFYFTATETENLKIKITINGRTQIIDFADCEYDTTYECYTASFTNITAIEFADEVKAEFMVGEEIVGNSALYTIDSFVYQWQSVTDSKYEKTINLVKALYNYGKSAWNSVH